MIFNIRRWRACANIDGSSLVELVRAHDISAAFHDAAGAQGAATLATRSRWSTASPTPRTCAGRSDLLGLLAMIESRASTILILGLAIDSGRRFSFLGWLRSSRGLRRFALGMKTSRSGWICL